MISSPFLQQDAERGCDEERARPLMGVEVFSLPRRGLHRLPENVEKTLFCFDLKIDIFLLLVTVFKCVV